MIPSPIGKVLSSFRTSRVRALLMGGQACVVYGAAEFSRDVDVAVLADDANLDRLRKALNDLDAEPVFFPPLGREVLLRGHACHFRSRLADLDSLRIDVMSVLHGCDLFEQLWERRRTIRLAGAGSVSIISLPDLVQAKKTQRDKDWPMLRRLVEADYQNRPKRPPRSQIVFWLNEARTPHLLIELVRRHPDTAERFAESRPAIRHALTGDLDAIAAALRDEEDLCRLADRKYWAPLRAELETWRSERNRSKRSR